MSPFNDKTTAAGKLTAESFFRAVDAVLNEPVHAEGCKVGQHLISATAEAAGYGRCVNCGAAITVVPRKA